MKIFPRGKRLLPKLLLVFVGISIGAVIAEIALRIADYSYIEFYQLDNSRGYALRPQAEGWYLKEGRSYVRINSDGLRDREHSKQKPPHTFRIAVIGDSYCEALQVPQEQAFWSVMEQQLQNCASLQGNKVEVLNFGVSGYGTAQELITVREQVWQYSPDLVLLAVTTNNDIADNVRALKRANEIPYFVHQNGSLVLDDSFKTTTSFLMGHSLVNRMARWVKIHSRLVQALNEGHHALKILLESWRARSRSSAPPQQDTQNDTISGELGIDVMVYRRPNDSTWNEAWSVTEDLIKELANEVKAHGASFVVVTLSNPPQVWPNANARQQFQQRIGVNDLLYPDQRINAFVHSLGMPVILLAPELQRYAEEHQVFLHGLGKNLGNGHWNQLGHRIAGELLAGKLCEHGFSK